MPRGNKWTPEEVRTLEMRVLPIIDDVELQKVDAILDDGNESWIGEEIRDHLFDAGFRVVKIDAKGGS